MSKVTNTIYIEPEAEQPQYNAETLAAMKEARDISSGEKQTESYTSTKELFEALDEED